MKASEQFGDATISTADGQAQDLLASIVQSSHDAIVATDLDGRIMSFNPGAERLYGYPAADMLGWAAEVNDARRLRILVSCCRVACTRSRTRRSTRLVTAPDETIVQSAMSSMPISSSTGTRAAE